jgi:hypothetical protein
VLKRFLICLLLFLPISCKRTAPPTSSQPTPATTETPQSQLDHVSGGTAPVETKYFKGSIGTSLDLQMKLVRSGEQLTGSYFYQRIGTKIDLRGTVDKEGNLSLEEFDPSGKQTGVFKGLWRTDPADGMVAISGNWTKPLNDKNADKKTAFSIHEEPISLAGDAELTTKQIKESNKKLMYEIAAQYPQLSGAANPNFEKFNQIVRASINKKVAGFKKEMAPQPDDEPRPEGSMGSDLSISYTVALAQDDLMSVDFAMSSYYQGAAHPNAFSEAINFDLKNGKELKLSDLFKPGAKYLAAISSYCINDLKKQSKEKDNMLDDSSIQNGAGPSAKNYESWTITKRGIGINFDPYQVGPYAAGAQYVLVPYSALKDLINPDGPVGQFAK